MQDDRRELEAAQLLLRFGAPEQLHPTDKNPASRSHEQSSAPCRASQQQQQQQLQPLSPYLSLTSGLDGPARQRPVDPQTQSDLVAGPNPSTPPCPRQTILRAPATPSSPSTRQGKPVAGRLVNPQRRSRPAEVLGNQPRLHPVVELGWQPLCAVHCNGFQGEFYGGHDRDLFVRCISGVFAERPLVDVAQGGSIMTCSGFEKAAGRELSKKWKESIHVVGEGEGSRATLVSWLRRRAQAQHGRNIVGQDVWILWVNEATYYQGHIESYSPDTGKHKVRYSDSLVEELYLPVEQIKFDSGLGAPVPAEPAQDLENHLACSEVVHAEPASEIGEQVSNLFHQNSSVSADSNISIIEELQNSDFRLAKHNRPQKARRLLGDAGSDRSLRRKLSHVSPDPPSAMAADVKDTPTIPRKLRTGVRAQTSPDIAAYLSGAVDGMTPRGGDSATPRGLERNLPRINIGTAGSPPQDSGFFKAAHTPRRPSPSAAAARLGFSQLVAPPVPPFAQGDPALMAQWMHHIALSLDSSMAGQASLAPQAGSTDAPPCTPLIPSARFQTMLVQAAQASSTAAWYSAMASRWLFFHSHDASVLHQKMAEFILSALYDFDQQQLHLCPPTTTRHTSPPLEA